MKKGVAFWQQLIYNTICVEEHETQKQKNARLAQLVEHLTLNQGVGTVIFLCVNMRFLTIEPKITMNCKDEVTCREIGRELVARK